jgi:hypothetical protein
MAILADADDFTGSQGVGRAIGQDAEKDDVALSAGVDEDVRLRGALRGTIDHRLARAAEEQRTVGRHGDALRL